MQQRLQKSSRSHLFLSSSKAYVDSFRDSDICKRISSDNLAAFGLLRFRFWAIFGRSSG